MVLVIIVCVMVDEVEVDEKCYAILMSNLLTEYDTVFIYEVELVVLVSDVYDL